MDEQLVAQIESKLSSLDGRLRLIVLALGVIISILLASLPWAYVMHGRVTSIETTVSNIEAPPEWFKEKVASNERAIHNLEARLRELELNGK